MFAILDAVTQINIPIDEVVVKEVLFVLFVMDYATKSGRWAKVGHAVGFGNK